MVDLVVRALCALILISGLIFWLAKQAAKSERVPAVLARLDKTAASGTRGAPSRRATTRRSGSRQSGSRASGGFARNLIALARPGSRDQGAPPVLSLVAQQQLGGRASVFVVDVDSQRLVLGLSDSGMDLLTSYEAPHVQEGAGKRGLVSPSGSFDFAPEEAAILSAGPAHLAPSHPLDPAPKASVGTAPAFAPSRDEFDTQTLSFDEVLAHLARENSL